MKSIIFGIGNYYQEQKEKLYCFNEIEIMAFTDNNSLLWGQKLNDILIISPDKIQTFEYDNILIMSIYVCEIYNQLRSLGVDEKRIIIWEQFDFKKKIKNSNNKNGKSSCTTWCVFNMRKMNKKARSKFFVFVSSSPRSEKVKKYIVREVCTKGISFV